MANKKIYTLCVLEVLKKYSDENNPLTHQKIIDYARQLYGVEIERKAVASNLKILEEIFDYDIIPVSRKGNYLGDRGLDYTDILYLMTYLMAARNIPANFAKNISNKLLNSLSENERKDLKDNLLVNMDKVDRTPNETKIAYTINNISNAIRRKRQISFLYNEYNAKGEMIHRIDKNTNEEKIYTVSPLYLVNSHGSFYLLTIPNHSKETLIKDFTIFRVELIDNVNTLDKKIEPVDTIAKYKNFNISEYLNQHPYLTGEAESIDMKLLVLNPTNGIRYIKDWFGKSAVFEEKDGKCYATIFNTAITPAFWWIMQYSEHFILLGPKSLIEKTRKQAKAILDTYKL